MKPLSKGDSYHHGDLRSALIAAGVANVTAGQEISLRALAKEVGVTPSALYRHFDNKEALLGAIAEEGFHQLESLFNKVKESHPQQRLIALGTAYLDFAQRHPGHYQVMFDRQPIATDPDDPLAKVCWSTFSALTESCAALSHNAEEAKRLAIACWSLVHGYALLTIHGHIALFPSPAPTLQSMIEALTLTTRDQAT
jgi:AcrR family transcriptional regulator